MKKKNYNIIGKVNCDKCGEICDLKEIIEPTPKQLKGAYYFKEWYHCKCGYWGREERNKVVNGKTMPKKQIDEIDFEKATMTCLCGKKVDVPPLTPKQIKEIQSWQLED